MADVQGSFHRPPKARAKVGTKISPHFLQSLSGLQQGESWGQQQEHTLPKPSRTSQRCTRFQTRCSLAPDDVKMTLTKDDETYRHILNPGLLGNIWNTSLYPAWALNLANDIQVNMLSVELKLHLSLGIGKPFYFHNLLSFTQSPL